MNATPETHYRRAPAGFTKAQWETFARDGILILEDVLSEPEIDLWLGALDRLNAAQGPTMEDGFFNVRNFIDKDPDFAGLIDCEHHIGYAHDLYGEQLKLQLSELFVRPPGSTRIESWHFDGPRVLPYRVFSPRIPLQIKVGYWLTDVSEPGMGNFTYVPGSHKNHHFDQYKTHDPAPGELALQVPRGSMIVFDCSLWHRSTLNTSAVTRKNVFVGYCPSWIPTYDRRTSDPAWLATLNREQRIIMRSYPDDHIPGFPGSFVHAKPPERDYPLFLDRDTGLDSDPGHHGPNVPMRHRKRTTGVEKLLEQLNS